MHNAATCPTCHATALTRNHYFTGKLMVERDFTDEQHYFRERLRLHNQRLHGEGVACGLAVRQHPNPACQDRYLLLEPGSAIDCCGNDILVTAEDTIDLQSFPSVKALYDKPDGQDHVLQLALCYRECPTEEIPVLYDDCACDDSQCAPNRILESYALDVVVDPVTPPPQQPPPGTTGGGASLQLVTTINVVHPHQVALDEAGGFIYAISSSGTSPSALYRIDAATLAIGPSYTMPAGLGALKLAVSPDGKRIYLFVLDGSATNGEMWFFDSANLAAGPTDHGIIQGSDVMVPMVAMSPSGILEAVYPSGMHLTWKPTDPPANGPPPNTVWPAGSTAVVASSDGKRTWVARGGDSLLVDDITVQPVTSQVFQVPNTQMNSLAVLPSSLSDKLAAGDLGNSKLYLIDPSQPSASALLATAALQGPPRAMVCSPDGAWVYVVERDPHVSVPGGTVEMIEIIDATRLLSGQPVSALPIVGLGLNAGAPVLTASGKRMYVPVFGIDRGVDPGGVAVFDITGGSGGPGVDCGAPLHTVRACPDCGGPDCLVLATIRGYQPGFKLLDPVNPPPSATDDHNNKIARINDLDGRKLLASTETLQEVIECILNQGGGGAPGPQGPPGPPGQPGQDGQPGKDGAPGPGLTTNLTRIVSLSWTHGQNGRLLDINKTPGAAALPSIIIGFSHKVTFVPGGLDKLYSNNVFQVEAPHGSEGSYLCNCQIQGSIFPVTNIVTDPNDPTFIVDADLTGTSPSEGLAFVVPQEVIDNSGTGTLRVRLLGDFIVDELGNAIAANFVRASLPTGDLRVAPPFQVSMLNHPDDLLGIPGGQFLSWFDLWTGTVPVPGPQPAPKKAPKR
jgi:DNA-binding beta-propeller fold protein YncE